MLLNNVLNTLKKSGEIYHIPPLLRTHIQQIVMRNLHNISQHLALHMRV